MFYVYSQLKSSFLILTYFVIKCIYAKFRCFYFIICGMTKQIAVIPKLE